MAVLFPGDAWCGQAAMGMCKLGAMLSRESLPLLADCERCWVLHLRVVQSPPVPALGLFSGHFRSEEQNPPERDPTFLPSTITHAALSRYLK